MTAVNEDSKFGLELERHGGGCCGITNLFSFPMGCGDPDCACGGTSTDGLEAEIREAIKEAIARNKAVWPGCYFNVSEEDMAKRSHAIEVVLTTAQVEICGDVLDTIGFKEVFSFKNSNSENVCHVFFYVTGQNGDY